MFSRVDDFCDPAPPNAGHSKQRFTSHGTAEDSSATAMPIRPMSLPWSTAPRCAWPRPGRSTGPCARPTASASARSRKSAPLPNQLRLLASRRSSRPAGQWQERKLRRPQGPRPPLPADPPAPTRCQPGQVLRRRFLRHQDPPRSHPRAGRSFVAHLADWAEKDRNALLCQLNSYPEQQGRCSMRRYFESLRPADRLGDSLGSGRDLPGPGGSGPVSLAQAETLLRDPLRRPQAQSI